MVYYSYNEILSNKKEVLLQMGEPWLHSVKWKKPDIEDYRLYDSISGKPKKTESRLIAGKDGWRGRNGEWLPMGIQGFWL